LRLPGDFPVVCHDDTGGRPLLRLFTPEEADLATKLSLIPQEPEVIARKAGLSPLDDSPVTS